MPMDTAPIRCTNCGTDSTVFPPAEARTLLCPRCGHPYFIAQGQKFSHLNPITAASIGDLRQNMKAALALYNVEEAARLAEEILDLCPGDFRALAVWRLNQFWRTSSEGLYQLLSQPGDCTEEDFTEVFPSLLEMGDLHTLELLRDSAVSRWVHTPEVRAKMLSLVDAKLKFMQKSAEQPDRSQFRDVFIGHGPASGPLAQQIAKALENGGYTCWSPESIASSSMEKIKKAISGSTVFLLLGTRDALQDPILSEQLQQAWNCQVPCLTLRFAEVQEENGPQAFLAGGPCLEVEADWRPALPDLLEALRHQVYDAPLIGPAFAQRTAHSHPKTKKETLPRETQKQRIVFWALLAGAAALYLGRMLLTRFLAGRAEYALLEKQIAGYGVYFFAVLASLRRLLLRTARPQYVLSCLLPLPLLLDGWYLVPFASQIQALPVLLTGVKIALLLAALWGGVQARKYPAAARGRRGKK